MFARIPFRLSVAISVLCLVLSGCFGGTNAVEDDYASAVGRSLTPFRYQQSPTREQSQEGRQQYELGRHVVLPVGPHLLRWVQTAGETADMICADTATPWVQMPIVENPQSLDFLGVVRDQFGKEFAWREHILLSPPADLDEDGLANELDPDMDGDGVANELDVFPFDSVDWEDEDGDGVGDNTDVFRGDPDNWSDYDRDGRSDQVHDGDDDNDGVPDDEDFYPLNSYESADSDLDGIGDNADQFDDDPLIWRDADEDGISDQQASRGDSWNPGRALASTSQGDWWDLADPLTRFQQYDKDLDQATLPAMPGDEVEIVRGLRTRDPLLGFDLTQVTNILQRPVATEEGIAFNGGSNHLDRLRFTSQDPRDGLSFGFSFRADSYAPGQRLGGWKPVFFNVDNDLHAEISVAGDAHQLGVLEPGRWHTLVFTYHYSSLGLIVWMDGERLAWVPGGLSPATVRVLSVGATDKGINGFAGEVKRVFGEDHPLQCSSARALHRWLLAR